MVLFSISSILDVDRINIVCICGAYFISRFLLENIFLNQFHQDAVIPSSSDHEVSVDKGLKLFLNFDLFMSFRRYLRAANAFSLIFLTYFSTDLLHLILLIEMCLLLGGLIKRVHCILLKLTLVVVTLLAIGELKVLIHCLSRKCASLSSDHGALFHCGLISKSIFLVIYFHIFIFRLGPGLFKHAFNLFFQLFLIDHIHLEELIPKAYAHLLSLLKQHTYYRDLIHTADCLI